MSRIEIRHASAPAQQDIRVNGVLIRRRDIAAEVANFPAETPAESWRLAGQALALREVLRQRARRLGVVAVAETDGFGRSETEEDATLRALLAIEVLPPRISQAEVNAFYVGNPERFPMPLAQTEERIAAYLAERAQHRTVASYLARAMAEANVEHIDAAPDSAEEAKLRHFVAHADDEAWLSLIGAMNRADDPSQAARAAILARENAA
jgi:hypothetical protein